MKTYENMTKRDRKHETKEQLSLVLLINSS